jgi:putative peptidoglycan lipid II flippase
MVRKILSFLNKQTEGLHQAAYLLAFLAVASQLLALLRDRILAGLFGAGVVLDIYYASFRIPDVIFALVASTVSISVLIPFLLNALVAEDLDKARKFVNDIFTAFFGMILLVSGVAFLCMPYLVRFVFPGFDDEEIVRNVVALSRLLLLSPILLGLSNLMGSITQASGKFLVYALSPLLYNIGIIFGALMLYPYFGIIGLGLGVILGASLHFLIQLPAVSASGFHLRFSKDISWTDIKRAVLISLPRTLALASGQITILILLSIASLISIGSITVFNLAYNLQAFPLVIIGASYSAAAFPVLSRLFGGGLKEKFFEQVSASVRHIIFWSVPATVLFVVLRAQVVRVAYGAGEFGWEATRLTAALVAIFVLSTIAQSLVILFTRAYYASGNTRKPLFINLFSAGIIIGSVFVLKAIFTKFDSFRYFIEVLLKVPDVDGTTILILPIGYSIGTLINLCLFWLAFQSDFGNFKRETYRSFFHISSASIVMGFVAHFFLEVFDTVFDLETLVGIFSQGFFAGIIGIISAVIILKLLGNQELKEMIETLRHKFWKTPVIVPDTEEL